VAGANLAEAAGVLLGFEAVGFEVTGFVARALVCVVAASKGDETRSAAPKKKNDFIRDSTLELRIYSQLQRNFLL
jgi:hypothetical protein